MSQDQEIEVKFYLLDLEALDSRLNHLGARLLQPRTFEQNLRFDTPGGELTRQKRVLRLRQDQSSLMTYKGPAELGSGASVRQEIEFTVGDFSAARRLLEALGYQVSVAYEKYRRVYELDGLEITLDEMPFGLFAEIEGPSAESIRALAARLNLDWQARVVESYLALFDALKQRLGLPQKDLTFAAFEGLHLSPADLALRPAD